MLRRCPKAHNASLRNSREQYTLRTVQLVTCKPINSRTGLSEKLDHSQWHSILLSLKPKVYLQLSPEHKTLRQP